VPWKLERLDSSQWQIGENRITRPSQWSDLLITDSGSSLPPPTTKNSGDWRMRRSITRVTSFGTKDDANMPQKIWRVRLQRAQRRANDLPAVRWKGRDHRPSTPYQQRHLMTLTPAIENFVERFCVEQYLFILLYITYCVPNFNALDTSINTSHPFVPNGVTMNLMCKIGTE